MMLRTKKTFLAALICSVLLLSLQLLPLFGQSAHADEGIKIYRLYSASGEHLYTASEEEANSLSKSPSWFKEGVAWNAPSTGEPVYRLYSPVSTKHLYTTDKNEISVLTSQHGWTLDFNGGPAFYSGGSIPIYRLYNSRSLNHLLTTDVNEYNVLPGAGWNQEGPAVYAVSLSSTGLTPPPVMNPTPAPSVSNPGSSSTSTSTYILNTNSKIFHKPSCASVSKMSAGNKQVLNGSRDQAIGQGYRPCKNCNP